MNRDINAARNILIRAMRDSSATAEMPLLSNAIAADWQELVMKIYRYKYIARHGHYGCCVDNNYSLSEIYPWEKLDLAHQMSIDLNIAPF